MESFELENKINELESKVKGSFFELQPRDGQFWRSVWDLIREIGHDFRTIRYPTAIEKGVAWARYQAVVDAVKQQQAQYLKQREQKYHDQKLKEQTSERLLGEIVSKAKCAWPHEDGFLEFIGLITGAKILADVLVMGIEMIVEVLTLGLLTTGEVDSEKEKLLSCSSQMKDAWELFKSHRVDLLRHHRDAAWKVLTGVQGELDKEWDKWKSEKNALWEERQRQFDDNRRMKEKLIAEAKGLIRTQIDENTRSRAKNIFQEWRAIRSAGKDHDDALWEDFREALDKFYSQSKEEYREHIFREIEKVEAMIEKAKTNRDSNDARLADARSDEYADRVREWIDEDDARIETYKGWLNEWEDKLRRLDD